MRSVAELLLAVTTLQLILVSAKVESAHSVVKHFRNVQKAVKERYAYSPDLVCATPRVHGLVRKDAGGTNQVAMHHNMNTISAAQYIFEGLPIYAACQLYISHKYKFIYVRQPKSSSTAIKEAIQATFCGEVCDDQEFTATLYVDDKTWREYFVFTWIRNPFTRIASAFDMMNKAFLFQRQGELGHEVGEHCSVDLLRFTENTNSMRSICQERGCCVYIAQYQQWIPWFIDQHINDQAHCVFSANGESMVDFIGRTESIEEDWALFLNEVNRRTNSTFQPLAEISNPNGHGDPEAGGVEHECKSARMQAMFNETTMWNIAMQYAADLLRFKYLPETKKVEAQRVALARADDALSAASP